MKCELCKDFQCPLEELKQHQEKSCPARFVVCPNGCGALMKLSTVKKHHENKCQLSIVNCEFAYAGCLLMMRRMDMKNHLESAKQEHIVLLSEKVKEMDSEIQRLKAENATKDSIITKLTASHERHQIPKKSKSAAQSSVNILLMNVPPGATEHNIRCTFGSFGRLSDVKMRGEGMAVVKFKEAASASRALEKHYSSGITIRKTKLDVRPE